MMKQRWWGRVERVRTPVVGAVACVALACGTAVTNETDPEEGAEAATHTVSSMTPQEAAVASSWVRARRDPDRWGLRTSNNPLNGDYRCVHAADNALWAWALAWNRPPHSLAEHRPGQLRALLMDMEYPDEPQIRRGWKLADPSPLCVNSRYPGIPFQPLHGVIEVSVALGAAQPARRFIERHLEYQSGRIAQVTSDDVAFHMLSAATATQIERPARYREMALAAWRELRGRIDRGRIDFHPDPDRDDTVTLRHLQVVFAMRRTADLLGDLDGNLVARARGLFARVDFDPVGQSVGNGTDRCATEQCFGYYLLAAEDETQRVRDVARAHRGNRCPADGAWRYRNKVGNPCNGYGSLEATALGWLADWKLGNTWGGALAVGTTCTVEVPACPASPGTVGSIVDRHDGSMLDRSRCWRRAGEYAVWCGAGPSTVITAVFADEGAVLGSASALERGCLISQSVCTAWPGAVGNFPDAYEGSDANPSRCMRRAEEYATWCLNPAGSVTTATYFERGEPTLRATATR